MLVNLNKDFWKHKRVLITGNTGFKGPWLTLWLESLGAEVFGYSLPPDTDPNHFELAGLNASSKTMWGDVCDYDLLKRSVSKISPEIIIHMAAQSLVLPSYEDPIGTFQINAMGTANILNVVRSVPSIRTVLVVTSDKCYQNKEENKFYCEEDSLGGNDPYSASKGCAEIITNSFRYSYFNTENFDTHQVGIASARSGNVIGGGDWSKNRLVPDIIRSLINNKPLELRYPQAVRPWQHVLCPLEGYLKLIEKLYANGEKYAGAYNFGPLDSDHCTVGKVLETFSEQWGIKNPRSEEIKNVEKEAGLLQLSSEKSIKTLNWKPKWELSKSIDQTVKWYKCFVESPKRIRDFSLEQIHQYEN